MIGEADPVWVLGVVVLSLASHCLRAQRWRVLLRPVGATPYGPALAATLVGFGASMVLPLRAGELLRPFLFSRRTGIGFAPAVTSVLVERVLDMVLVLACFVAVTFTHPDLAAYRLVAVAVGAGGAGLLGALFLAVRFREGADRLVEGMTRPLPLRWRRPIGTLASGLLDGARGLADVPTLLLVLALSAVLWALITGTYLVSFLALAVVVPLVPASLATMVIVAAFVFLPQAPGFVGTWQKACDVSLHEIFKVPHDRVVAYSMLTWVIQIVVNVGAGAVALAFQDLSVRDLVQVTKGGASAPAEGS